MMRDLGRWAVGIGAAVGLAGCSLFAPSYAPPEPPRQAGLVIVFGDMRTPLVRWGRVFAGGATEDVRPLDYGGLVSDTGANVQGRGLEGGALVFNARPGHYRVRTVGYLQRRSTGPYPVDFAPPAGVLAQFPALAFDVRPGEIVIVGKVLLRYRDASMVDDFALESFTVTADPAGERAALTAVLAALDPASPWHAVVAQRLAKEGQ